MHCTEILSVVLPKHYAEPDRSGLTLDIRRGEQHCSLDLLIEDGDPAPIVRPEFPIGAEAGNQARDSW